MLAELFLIWWIFLVVEILALFLGYSLFCFVSHWIRQNPRRSKLFNPIMGFVFVSTSYQIALEPVALISVFSLYRFMIGIGHPFTSTNFLSGLGLITFLGFTAFIYDEGRMEIRLPVSRIAATFTPFSLIINSNSLPLRWKVFPVVLTLFTVSLSQPLPASEIFFLLSLSSISRRMLSDEELSELVDSVSVLLSSRFTRFTFYFFSFLQSFSRWPIFPQTSHLCLLALHLAPCSFVHPASPHSKQYLSLTSVFFVFLSILPTGSSLTFVSAGCFLWIFLNSLLASTVAFMDFSMSVRLFSQSCFAESWSFTVWRKIATCSSSSICFPSNSSRLHLARLSPIESQCW